MVFAVQRTPLLVADRWRDSSFRLRRRDEAGALGPLHPGPPRPAGPLAAKRPRARRPAGSTGTASITAANPAAATGNFAARCPSTGRSATTPLKPHLQDPPHLLQAHRALSRAGRELGMGLTHKIRERGPRGERAQSLRLHRRGDLRRRGRRRLGLPRRRVRGDGQVVPRKRRAQRAGRRAHPLHRRRLPEIRPPGGDAAAGATTPSSWIPPPTAGEARGSCGGWRTISGELLQECRTLL